MINVVALVGFFGECGLTLGWSEHEARRER
jgi:hypothetical protein